VAQEKKISKERSWINNFRLKQPQDVKQREAQLEKLAKSSDYVQKPPFTGKPFRFRFPAAPHVDATYYYWILPWSQHDVPECNLVIRYY
jgi:hypothetical protein